MPCEEGGGARAGARRGAVRRGRGAPASTSRPASRAARACAARACSRAAARAARNLRAAWGRRSQLEIEGWGAVVRGSAAARSSPANAAGTGWQPRPARGERPRPLPPPRGCLSEPSWATASRPRAPEGLLSALKEAPAERRRSGTRRPLEFFPTPPSRPRGATRPSPTGGGRTGRRWRPLLGPAACSSPTLAKAMLCRVGVKCVR